MATYVSLLRGINVSGQKKIRMEDLRALYEDLGYGDVRSYIQSGNVVFTSGEKSAERLAASITGAIDQHYGFEVPVIIRTGKQMLAVSESNPYLERKGIDETKLHVCFLSGKANPAALKTIPTRDIHTEEITPAGKELYLHYPDGMGRSKLSNTYLERKLGLTATTRNWKTVKTLTEMAG